MIQDLGKIIRSARIEKGIGLNAFAAELEVSPAYLSNLENGKTESVHLSVLHRLEQKLDLSFLDIKKESTDERSQTNCLFRFRVEKAMEALLELGTQNPSVANSLLNILEQGAQLLITGPSINTAIDVEPSDYH